MHQIHLQDFEADGYNTFINVYYTSILGCDFIEEYRFRHYVLAKYVKDRGLKLSYIVLHRLEYLSSHWAIGGIVVDMPDILAHELFNPNKKKGIFAP